MKEKTIMARFDLKRAKRVVERFTFRFALSLLGFSGSVMIFASGADAGALYFDRNAFLSDSQITTTTAIDFDTFVTEADLTGQTVSGVTLNASVGNALSVIDAATGVRYPMSASSGSKVLSPGGSNPDFENDGLELLFATPVRAAGIDVVFDVPDGASYVEVYFYNEFGGVLDFNGFIPAPSGSPGYQFVGYVADSDVISRVLFNEFDPTAYDDNVAYDSLVFSPAATPEPSSMLLLGFGLAGIASMNRGRFDWSRKV